MLITCLSPPLCWVKGGGLSQPRDTGARSNFHPPWSTELAAQAELLDQGAVALDVLPLQVVQETAAPADQLEQPATRVVVVLVRPEVLGQLVDALRKHRDLDLRRAGVGLVL